MTETHWFQDRGVDEPPRKCFLPASPWDYLTSTRDGKTRFDARKTWEAGAFIVSTFAFCWLVYGDKLTEWFFIGYMGTWVGARFLRDREQRLNKPEPK